jgi:hypothetical protein
MLRPVLFHVISWNQKRRLLRKVYAKGWYLSTRFEVWETNESVRDLCAIWVNLERSK